LALVVAKNGVIRRCAHAAVRQKQALHKAPT
jgi:hypothetical protein